MGGLSGVATTFIVIIAAGFGVLMGFAMFHRVVNNRNNDNSEPEDPRTGVQQTQASYMQQVRERNRMDLFAKFGGRQQVRPVAHDVESAHGSESYY